VKKLLLFIFYFFLFANPTSALIEVDITRGNLEPLPIASSEHRKVFAVFSKRLNFRRIAYTDKRNATDKEAI